jgi:hypothetical protein
MCHPAVAIAFTVLQAGAQYMGQSRQAKATHKYQVEKQRLTVASAADAARHQYQGLAARTEQVRAAATQDVNNQLKAYQRAQGSLRAAASAGGVMGDTVEEAGIDFAQQFVDARTSRLMNLSWEENQILASAQGIYAQQRGRTEGTTFAPVPVPSALGAVAQAGAGAANIWMNTQGHPFWGGSTA